LYYRLNVVPLRLPPLRERGQDIPDLARHFFKENVGLGLPEKKLNKPALDRLKAHSWPGNVRELENLVQRLSALYPQDTITAELIDSELHASQPSRSSAAGDSNSNQSLTTSVNLLASQLLENHSQESPVDDLYQTVLHQMEEPLILTTLKATRGNQIQAAKVLGLNRNTLRKKIKELDLGVTKGIG